MGKPARSSLLQHISEYVSSKDLLLYLISVTVLFFLTCVGYNYFGMDLSLVNSIYFAIDTPLGGMGPGDFNYSIRGRQHDRIIGSILMIMGSFIVTINIGVLCMWVQMRISRSAKTEAVAEYRKTILERKLLDSDSSTDSNNLVSSSVNGAALQLINTVMVYYSVWLCIGTVGYAHIEDVDYVSALYWSCQMMTGCGMGDVAPKSDIGKYFCAVWLFGAIVVSLDRITASNIFFQNTITWSKSACALRKAVNSHKKSADGLNEEYFAKSETVQLVRTCGPIDEIEKKRVTPAEFVLWLAVESEECSEDFLTYACSIFKSLDINEDGYIYQTKHKKDKSNMNN